MNKPTRRPRKAATTPATLVLPKPAVRNPSVPTVVAADLESRTVRKKRETREKLLAAAFKLMAERGMDAVAINEITDEADVGFGTFYNHFESKEAIYAAVLDTVFEDFADALDHLESGIDDPAEILSVSVRHVILRALREPLWGRFLIRESYSVRAMTRGLGARMVRDIQRGLQQKRFQSPDPILSSLSAGTAVLGAISAQIEIDGEPGAPLRAMGLTSQNLPERAVAMILANLGLPYKEALKVAQRPLPVVDRLSASS
jgi:AcrR family transcriptional regulator